MPSPDGPLHRVPPPTLGASSGTQDDVLPFLPDPYVDGMGGPAGAHPLVPPLPAPPARTPLSRLAASSVISALLLGPVGAVLAVVFGWYARRDIETSRPRRRGFALATAGMALGLLLTPAWGAALSYFAWTHTYRSDLVAEEPPPPRSPAPAAPAPPGADPSPAPTVAAPARTQIERRGAITVVDLGRATASLSDELARQRAEAAAAHETLLLMTTAARCNPCGGVDRALTDPMMQTALAHVRLVRVDSALFHEDLTALRIPHERIPGFFLLAPDLAPRDGIDGGEWDDDITPNIAPVLGAFARGKYKVRREPWRPLPGSGMSL